MHENSLIISDTQAPFQHPDALAFLAAVADEVRPTSVLHVGDETDNHALSVAYKAHPNAPSAGDEFEQAKAWLDDLERLFPELCLCMSNHGARLWKAAQFAGIPNQWIRSPREAYDKPRWEWAREWKIDWRHGTVIITHGDRCKGALRYARMLGCSVAQGHHHQDFGIQYQNSRALALFGMDVGCLVDAETYALHYAKEAPLGQMLGCGAIVDGWPRLFPMETDAQGRWAGRLV